MSKKSGIEGRCFEGCLVGDFEVAEEELVLTVDEKVDEGVELEVLAALEEVDDMVGGSFGVCAYVCWILGIEIVGTCKPFYRRFVTNPATKRGLQGVGFFFGSPSAPEVRV